MNFAKDFKNGVIDIFTTIVIKDPCDTCIVRACCSEECEDYYKFRRFIFPHDSLKSKRFFAWVVIVSVCFALFSWSAMLIRLIK